MNVRYYLFALPLVAEAFFELLLARIKIAGNNGKKVLSKLQNASDSEEISITDDQKNQAKQIGRIIRFVLRYTRWSPTCLVQSLAAIRMIRRRGLSGLLYIGVNRGDDHQFGAHAWVCVGDVDVCGGRQASDFKIISVYDIRS